VNRDEHPSDEYVRRLPLVADDQVRLLPDDAKQALFQELVMVIDTQPPRVRSRVRRTALALALAVALLAFPAIGWAVYRGSIADSTGVSCHITEGSESIVSATTGDPLADCAEQWRFETASEPPPLVAYDNGHGGIEVFPEGVPVPADFTRLGEGVVQDPRAIELQSALDDYIDGLSGDCYSSDEAQAIVMRELGRLGLVDWEVTVDRAADGERRCALAFAQPERRLVTVVDQGSHPDDGAPDMVFARELRAALQRDCLTLADAAALTREVAAAQGIGDDALIVHEVPDDTASCTRADLTVGGIFDVTLRGPQGPGN
jgi:hypothetical protein